MENLLNSDFEDFDVSSPEYEDLCRLRADLLNVTVIRDGDVDFSSDSEGRYRLTLGSYIVTEMVFDSPSDALDWVHTHPVSLILSVCSIVRSIDEQDRSLHAPVSPD